MKNWIVALLLGAALTVSAHEMNMHMAAGEKTLKVAVVLFDGVEEIDYAGPIEVFGASGATVLTVGLSKAPVTSVYGLRVLPEYDTADLPDVDVLLVPGGGIGEAWKNPQLLAWIKERSAKVRVTMSVCSGAFILGKAGLLDGRQATTTSSMRDELARHFPKAQVMRQRFVDAGKLITTAGLSAGIDGSLYLVQRELGAERAKAAAGYMEYDWRPQPESK
ncbi:DJ-1/PfpI family protein [Duganella sp. CF517]|uniref:DJ-1/PfpI family protein n=1 Tax=Duganella sp. CF517 TaxID=1881038 RepID=UPI0008BB0919|nr:DJ-1/PfpI family protein [Duganella sp. CF517]SEN66452.1 DJ-1/PfpI family protein [Duganella sp. CF517]